MRDELHRTPPLERWQRRLRAHFRRAKSRVRCRPEQLRSQVLGDNDSGRFIPGDVSTYTTPTSTGKTAAQAPHVVAIGNTHTCLVGPFDDASGGDVTCWGDNSNNQAPNSSLLPQKFFAVAAGSNFSCGIEFVDTMASYVGRLVCWGSNDDGRLGIGSASNAPHDPEYITVTRP